MPLVWKLLSKDTRFSYLSSKYKNDSKIKLRNEMSTMEPVVNR